ncbi:MAG: hypothetical protein H0T88_06345 [Lysobacter sp.]|nr:hypothetical protein [Lysobacter sp.]
MRMTVTALTLLLAAMAGCADQTPVPPALPPASDPPVQADTVDHQPRYDIPPAAAPALPAPATDAPSANHAVGFDGFGDALWGADEQAIRDAWGAGLETMPSDLPEGCRYLLPRARPNDGYGMGFMLEGQRLVRIDVDSASTVAPGGGRIGMTADQIMQLHGDAVEVQNHKYVQGGRYLRIPDPAGGGAVILFETDASGRVSEWRIGMPPQVDYVEGCS